MYAKLHHKNIGGKRYMLYSSETSERNAKSLAKDIREERGWLSRAAIIDKRYTGGEKVWGVYIIETRQGK